MTLTAYKIAVVHKAGGVSGESKFPPSPLSCKSSHDPNFLMVYLTDSQNNPIVPQSPTYPADVRKRRWYHISAYTSISRLVVCLAGDDESGYLIEKHKTFLLWYGEALFKYSVKGNYGQSCADVLALV